MNNIPYIRYISLYLLHVYIKFNNNNCEIHYVFSESNALLHKTFDFTNIHIKVKLLGLGHHQKLQSIYSIMQSLYIKAICIFYQLLKLVYVINMF